MGSISKVLCDTGAVFTCQAALASNEVPKSSEIPLGTMMNRNFEPLPPSPTPRSSEGTEPIPRYGASRSEQVLILLSKGLDALIIGLVLVEAVTLYRTVWDPRYGIAVLVAAIVFLLVAEVAGLYRPWRGETFKLQFFQILFVWSTTFFVLLLLAYAFQTSGFYSRIVVGVWLVTTPFFLSGWRVIGKAIFSYVVAGSKNRRNALVWGTSGLGDQLARTIERSPWLGLDLVAHLEDEEIDDPPVNASEQSANDISQLERIVCQAQRGKFDILYIALPTTARTRINEIIERLSDSTVSIYMVPDYLTTSLSQGKWSNLEGIPLVSIYDTPFWGVDGWVKRAEDLILAGLILLVVAIPMLVIAAAVKLTSPGPVLFRQHRYGIYGKEISVRKFRTMYVCEDGEEVPQAGKNDPRVTKLGVFLRRTSLDELPQFINVLLGNMSIVGPRPHAVAHNELYRKQIKGYMLRHRVRPGITGWAQVNGWRGETDDLYKMEKRVEYDLWYIHNWSLWLDLKIVFLTLLRGFTGEAAY